MLGILVVRTGTRRLRACDWYQHLQGCEKRQDLQATDWRPNFWEQTQPIPCARLLNKMDWCVRVHNRAYINQRRQYSCHYDGFSNVSGTEIVSRAECDFQDLMGLIPPDFIFERLSNFRRKTKNVTVNIEVSVSDFANICIFGIVSLKI